MCTIFFQSIIYKMKAMKIFFILSFNILYLWKTIHSVNQIEGFLCESIGSSDFALFFIKNFHKLPIFEANLYQNSGKCTTEMVTTHINEFLKKEDKENPLKSVEINLNVLVHKAEEQCQKLWQNPPKKFARKIWTKIGEAFKNGEAKNLKISENKIDDNVAAFIPCIYHFLYRFSLELINKIENDQQQDQFDSDELSEIKKVYLNLYENSLKMMGKYFKTNFTGKNYLCDLNGNSASLFKKEEIKSRNNEKNLSKQNPSGIISKLSEKIDKNPRNIKSSKEIASAYNKLTKFVKQSIENLNYKIIQKCLELKWFVKIFANFKQVKFFIFTDLLQLKDKLILAMENKSVEAQKMVIKRADRVLSSLSSNVKFQNCLKQALNQKKEGINDDKMDSSPFFYINKMIEVRKSSGGEVGIRAKRQIGTDLTALIGYCAFYFGLAVLFIGAPIVAAVFLFPSLLALFFVTGWVGVPAAKVFFENCVFGF